MMHILRDGHTYRPWWPTDQRWGIGHGEKVWCDCCNSWGLAGETDTRLRCQEIPVGGFGVYQDQLHPYGPDPELDQGFQPSWFDATWTVRCSEGFGCTIKPRRRASAHLRERY